MAATGNGQQAHDDLSTTAAPPAPLTRQERRQLIAALRPDPITAADARKIIPASGFLRDYCALAQLQLGDPLPYHLGCALALISVCIPPDFEIRVTGGRVPMAAPFWIMLVGKTGTNKSRAVNHAKSFLDALAAGEHAGVYAGALLGRPPGTVEGLIDALAENPRQIHIYPEFAQFLQRTASTRGYSQGLREVLLDVFDGGEVGDALARGNARGVDKPRLTMLAAVAPSHLEKHTSENDWDGGFMNRWLIIHAPPGAAVSVAPAHPTLEARVLSYLERIVSEPVGNCVAFTPGAAKKWDAFFHLMNRAKRANDSFATVLARIELVTLRSAVAYAVSQGKGAGGIDWHLDEEALQFGRAMAGWYTRGLVWGNTQLAVTDYQRARKRVLEYLLAAITEQGRKVAARWEAEIAGHMRMRKRDLDDVLGGIVREGIVVTRTRSRGADEDGEGGETATLYILKEDAVAKIGTQIAEGRAESEDGR